MACLTRPALPGSCAALLCISKAHSRGSRVPLLDTIETPAPHTHASSSPLHAAPDIASQPVCLRERTRHRRRRAEPCAGWRRPRRGSLPGKERARRQNEGRLQTRLCKDAANVIRGPQKHLTPPTVGNIMHSRLHTVEATFPPATERSDCLHAAGLLPPAAYWRYGTREAIEMTQAAGLLPPATERPQAHHAIDVTSPGKIQCNLPRPIF